MTEVEKEVTKDSRIKLLYERLGNLTYQIAEHTGLLNRQLIAFQQKLNQDKKLDDLRQESNAIGAELEKLKNTSQEQESDVIVSEEERLNKI